MYEKKENPAVIARRNLFDAYGKCDIFTLNEDIECRNGIFRKGSKVFVEFTHSKDCVKIYLTDKDDYDFIYKETDTAALDYLNSVLTKDEQASEEYRHAYYTKDFKACINEQRSDGAKMLCGYSFIVCLCLLFCYFQTENRWRNISFCIFSAAVTFMMLCGIMGIIFSHKAKRLKSSFCDTKKRLMTEKGHFSASNDEMGAVKV